MSTSFYPMSKSDTIYSEQRRSKAKKLRAQGIDPYANTFKPSSLCQVILQKYESWSGEQLEKDDQTYSLAGRVVANRPFGKAGFLKLRDRSGELQIFCQQSSFSAESFGLYKDLDIGDFVFVVGQIFRTKTAELTLRADSLSLVTKGLQTLPEKWHGLTDVETRYRQRYIDLIANPGVRATFKKRSQIINGLRRFLVKQDFLEVETPMMHPIPGGASAAPFVTHHNALGMDLYLRIAPELYLKRLVVGGLERVFEINRNFRNEGISIQHNPEFTMLEFYQSYATYEDLMGLVETMLASVAFDVAGAYEIKYQDRLINWQPPYKKLSLAKALVEIGGFTETQIQDEIFLRGECHKRNLEQRGKTGGIGVLQTLLFEHTVEKKLLEPTFITHYPTEVSPLARRNDKNPAVTDRFEFYVYGREIANAFSELNDPEDQKARFMAQVKAREEGDDEAMYFDADYIEALEYGMPPTAGCGIGVDRLVMLLTDSPSIRDVILFPQLRRSDSSDS